VEVHLSPELQTKLALIAAARGSEAELLVREAIKRFVDYNDWFLREVDKGLTSANKDAMLSHGKVGKRLEVQLANKLPPQ
jgi:predicted transcriptional regulator